MQVLVSELNLLHIYIVYYPLLCYIMLAVVLLLGLMLLLLLELETTVIYLFGSCSTFMFQLFQQGEEEEVFKIIFISGKVSCLGLKKN